MGLFSWLSGLFGRKKVKVPDKVVEFRNRPRAKGAATAQSRGDYGSSNRDYSPREESSAQQSASKDYFDLAGDRAEREKAKREAEEMAASQSPEEPEPAPAPAYDFGAQFDSKPAEAEPAPETAPSVEDDYSPLDLAREISGETETASETYQEPEYLKIDQTAGAFAEEQPVPAEESLIKTAEADSEKPGAIELGASVPPETAASEPETTAPEPEPEAEEIEPLAGGIIQDEHALETLDVETVEGQGTVTIERKRIETKTINVAGDPFDLVLYEYQNGTKAARVPRAAIEKMTEVAKQNNLKVLPRRQNAAIMAGRYLDVPRAQLQDLAEKEKYHLVDFTDTYYEICFGDLPEA